MGTICSPHTIVRLGLCLLTTMAPVVLDGQDSGRPAAVRPDPALPEFAGAAAALKSVVLDNFETYTNDQQLAKAWYRPPHGGGTTQTIEKLHLGGGRQSLKWEYHTTKDEKTHYSAICRVAKWDATGCNAAQFWLKPDGSGRQITFQLNIANAQGKNIHDLWQTVYVPKKGDTAGRVVTIPFANLEHNIKYADSPATSPVFKPEALIEIAFYINGRNDEPGDGVYYIDEIKGVHLDEVRPYNRARSANEVAALASP